MLNEKRVKHMVKLAMYENKTGEEDLKVSAYYKKDFISFNMLWSIIWMTVAYLIIAVLFIIAKMEMILSGLSIKLIVSIATGVIGIYVALVVLIVIISRRFYKKKHARAYHRVKKFKEGLGILQDMYQEEKLNG